MTFPSKVPSPHFHSVVPNLPESVVEFEMRDYCYLMPLAKPKVTG